MGGIQERLSVPSSSSSPCSLSKTTTQPKGDSLLIDDLSWMIAEERAHEILSIIQPIFVSDRNRIEIIDYVRALIKSHDGIEVFSFGSVPLKTYLPDGDIDMTVITKQNVEDKFFEKLYNTLKSEEGKSEFHVTDVKFIPAQVKVIKCNIRNISVDISFNQMAGLCALCFLEQVDQLFGKDHIFKRSIILIKAWCYYESRILGANTGLFSTYALSVLVLFIINLFHSSLSGPLSVLYKFLDYYGSFDWSNYCISLRGPVPISCLPELVASPENGHELLLDEKFLRDCVELYSAPAKSVETNGLEFPIKHLNIVDPLKHSNNLGKSVTVGNVQRVKHAFQLGARKLREILLLPGETIGWRLEKFYGNSLDRNGKGQRQDVNDPVTAFGTGRSELSELSGDFQAYFGRLMYGKMCQGYNLPGTIQHSYQTNEFYLRGPNGSTSTQPLPLHSLTNGSQNMGKRRGTGTYIPDMSQQLYHARFKGLGARNSSSHQREAYTEAIDDGKPNSFRNLSGQVSTSCPTIKEEECVEPETCNEICQSPPENLGVSISSSTLVMENGKEEESKTSQTLKGS